jgi:pimeloyl-ACP methyl ester carboxylesterase
MMVSFGCASRPLCLIGAIVIGCQVAACATQPRENVQVTVGSGAAQVDRAKDYAALYLPYAMMATAAYTNPQVLDSNRCPDAVRLADPSRAKDQNEFDFHRNVRIWIGHLKARNWECHFGFFGNLPCPQRYPDCRPVGGLEFHVWRRMKNGCREVAIAFRGSDPNDLGDWQSNFRWLYRLAPRFDQYDQVRVHMGAIVDKIERNGCNKASTIFVSTGHSLGGGLAQQAAYAHPKFNYVFAFDPSPVTGFFDVSALLREENTKELGIDRAYEAGEILSLPRQIIEGIIPPSSCDPRVRSVRFNLLSGAPVVQHSMPRLTETLRAAAATPGANGPRVSGRREAMDCGKSRTSPMT